MDRGGPDRPVGGLSVRAPTGVELRPASRDDLADVLRLLAERTSVQAPRAGSADTAADWNAFLGSVDAAPFLAIADGAPAGCLLLSFRRRMNFATWEAWVPELVVAEPFRGRGIGRALLRIAIEEWRLRRAHRLAVETWAGEETGRALLLSLGFAEELARFLVAPPQTRGGASPPEVTLRRVDGGDADAAGRLVAEMGPYRSPLPDRTEAVGRAFRQLIARDGDRSMLALLDGVPVGICTLELRRALRAGGLEAWVPEIVVTEHARGRGIGGLLLDAALADAEASGATAVNVECQHRRATARHLFASAGFRSVGSTFTLDRDR